MKRQTLVPGRVYKMLRPWSDGPRRVFVVAETETRLLVEPNGEVAGFKDIAAARAAYTEQTGKPAP